MHAYKKLHGANLNENDNFKATLMHVYNFLYGAILTENGNFKYTKLVMHGYKLLNASSTEMKTQKREIIYLIFWDRRINVICRRVPSRGSGC